MNNRTVFGRGEITENRELLDLAEHGPAYRVGKVSLGAVRDFRLAEHLTLGAGAERITRPFVRQSRSAAR